MILHTRRASLLVAVSVPLLAGCARGVEPSAGALLGDAGSF